MSTDYESEVKLNVVQFFSSCDFFYNSRQFCSHLFGICVCTFRIRGHPIFSYTILSLQGITVSICFLFRYVSLRFCSDSRTIKRCMVSYSGIVILRWWCQCFAFALEHITTFAVTIMRLLLLPLPLRVVAIVVVRIQMRFAILVICSSVVRLVWMSLIALHPASFSPHFLHLIVFSTRIQRISRA